MSRIVTALFLAAATAVAQSGIVWQPPKLDLPDSLPKATVPKEMITKLWIGTMPIILEETPLKDAEKNLGGTIGTRGDASEALAWLCFHGSDVHGRWVLWLESSEMGGGSVDGFAWQRMPRGATVDRRCGTEDVKIDLPTKLALGLTEAEVRNILGRPTAKYRNTVVFYHEHEEKIRNEDFDASNTIYVMLRDGVVQTLQVWKTTSN